MSILPLWENLLGKIKRLRQAKEEAEEEIETYRLSREMSYQDFLSKNMDTKEDVVAQIEKDTNVYLDQLEKTVQEHKEKVNVSITQITLMSRVL